MTTAGVEDGVPAKGRRIPAAAVAALIAASAAIGLAAKATFDDRAEAARAASDRRREDEALVAMARSVAGRERGRPAPASGVRLLPRTVVRSGTDATGRSRVHGWSPDGERFAILREDHFPLVGFERDVTRHVAEVRDLDGALLAEVPLPGFARGSWDNVDAQFALTSSGSVVVDGGMARVADRSGRETARIAGPEGQPIRGVAAAPSRRILAWSGDRVVLAGEDGSGRAEFDLHLPGNWRAWNVAMQEDGSRAVFQIDTGNGTFNSEWISLDLASKEVAPLGGNATRVVPIPGSRILLATHVYYSSKPAWTFEVRDAADPVRWAAGGVADAAPLPGGRGIASHGRDGAMQVRDLEGKVRIDVPGALDSRWYTWKYWERALAVPSKGDAFATLRNADGPYVRLWSLDGKPLARDPLPGTPDVVLFSPAGDRILVGYQSGLASVLEIERVPPK